MTTSVSLTHAASDGSVSRALFAAESTWSRVEGETRIIRSTCWGGGGCHGGCGVLLHVKGGKLVRVEGNPEHPYNQGRLCAKVLALPQLVHHPSRLIHPLLRVGQRGEGKWKPISWEEAYDLITHRLEAIRREFGPEAVLFCRGTGRDISAYISLLAYSYGSPNHTFFLSGNACYLPRVATSTIILGNYPMPDASQFLPDRYHNPNWRPPRCLAVWGTDPLSANDNGFYGHWVVDCMKLGAKLIVVDPRLTWLSSRAAVWLQLRPGTDAALALGLLNVIINEELYDKEFVDRWVFGFGKLKETVQEYPPPRVAEITWLSEEKIWEAARLYAQSKPAAIQWGVGIDMTQESVGAAHAILSLSSITGNLDVPGGNVLVKPPFGVKAQAFGWKSELLTEEQRSKMIGLRDYVMLQYMGYTQTQPDRVMEQIVTGKPYPIKAAWIQTTNPIACTSAAPQRLYECLMGLDFIVAVDLFMTPTAMLADVVLPAASFAERDSVAAKLGHTFSAINKALTVGESKPDAEINLELARRLNPKACSYAGVEEVLDDVVRPVGVTFSELREHGWLHEAMLYRKHESGHLRADGKPGFNTPTGKIELYSQRLKDWGLKPSPYFEEPPESPTRTPDLFKDYPLILTSAKSPVYMQSEHRQVPWLRQIEPDPILEIHPETASQSGFSDGDWVWVESRWGRCQLKAKENLGIHPKVVCARNGWWFPEKTAAEPSLFGVWQSNINLLVPAGWQGSSGFGNAMKAMLCRVHPCQGGITHA